MPIPYPWTWTVQIVLLFGGGILYLFAPGFGLAAQTGNAVDSFSPLAVDQLRMSSPYLFGLGGFTLFALMTNRTALRPRLALTFVFAFAAWSAVQWRGVAAGHFAAPGILAGVLATLLAVGNLRLARAPALERLVPEEGGIPDTKPPQAFVFWLLQGSVLLSGALAFLFAPALVLSLISGNALDSPLLSPLAIQQTSLLGALATGMALLSFVAIGTLRDFAWRGFSFFFSFFLGVWVISISWILVWGHYARPVLLVLLPGLAFLPANLALYQMHGEGDLGGASRRPDAWSVIDLVAGPIMALFVPFTRRRSSHLVGVAARGEFHPDRKAEGVPVNDFFDGATSFPVSVRFANLTELDDAALDVRGCAIKFSDHQHSSPLDLMLNTGSFCPAFNLWTFAGFVVSKLVPTTGSEWIVRRNLVAREGGVAGLRRAPDSFLQLRYHGQIVRDWVSSAGRHVLVRYRCVPDNDKPESGLPDDADAARIWVRQRREGELRATNYLRRELRARLAKGSAKMRLQAQFHAPQEGDSVEWYNASVDWDEAFHPWRNLGTIELREALGDVDAELLQFDPGNHPMSLSIPNATSPFDYRSLGDSEARVVRALQRIRLSVYATLGLPSFDERER